MGEAKRIAEAEQQRRNKKIDFLRKNAPDWYMARIFSGKEDTGNLGDLIDTCAIFHEVLEKKCREIATGEEE